MFIAGSKNGDDGVTSTVTHTEQDTQKNTAHVQQAGALRTTRVAKSKSGIVALLRADMHGKAQSSMYFLKYWLWYSLILLSRTLPNSKMEVMYNSNTSHVPTAIGWLCTCTAISFSVYESTAKRTKIYAPIHNTQRRNEQIKTWYLQFVGMDLRGRIYDICRRHWLEFRLWFPWSK